MNHSLLICTGPGEKHNFGIIFLGIESLSQFAFLSWRCSPKKPYVHFLLAAVKLTGCQLWKTFNPQKSQDSNFFASTLKPWPVKINTKATSFSIVFANTSWQRKHKVLLSKHLEREKTRELSSGWRSKPESSSKLSEHGRWRMSRSPSTKRCLFLCEEPLGGGRLMATDQRRGLWAGCSYNRRSWGAIEHGEPSCLGFWKPRSNSFYVSQDNQLKLSSLSGSDLSPLVAQAVVAVLAL